MRLQGVCIGISYTLLQGMENPEIKDIVYDSRKVSKGVMFVCLTGAETDGHKYIPEAVEKGSRYLSLLFTEILGDEEASAECVELILESRRNEGMGMTKQENGSSITSMMTKGSTTVRMVPD